jgi:hypothetical protein
MWSRTSPVVIRAPLLWVFHPPPQDVQQVQILFFLSPRRARAVIAQFGRFDRGVSALEKQIKFRRLLSDLVGPEPRGFDHASAERGWLLLILSREVVLALGNADGLKNLQRLTLRMKSFASTPSDRARAVRSLDHMRFVLDRDGWEAEDFPLPLLQHVAHEVVLVQPLHNDDNAARILIIEAAVQSVLKPIIYGIALRL